MGERIDITQFEGLTTPWDFHAKYLHIESAKVAVELIAELKICYEAIDVLSKSTIDDAVNNIKLAKKLAKQNRDIEEIIDCLDGVDSIFGEEIIGMLRPLLARF